MTGTASAFALSSEAFGEGGSIPREHTCDGEDVSPPLSWTGPPDGTRAFALIVDDPDARGFVHWVVINIPGSTAELARGASGRAAEFTEGRNDFGRTGYGGPCPPSGTHRYAFRLYALSAELQIGESPTADEVRSAMDRLVLAEALLTGSYRRA